MQLGLRTKLTLLMTGLALLTVTVLSLVFLEQLLQLVLDETDQRAHELVHEVYDSAGHALEDAKMRGFLPSSSEIQDTHDYVRKAFETSDWLEARLQSATDDPWVYEVSIVDRNGEVLVSSDTARIGKTVLRRPPFAQLVQSPFVRQVRILAEKPQQYEVEYPFKVRGEPFGEVLVVVETSLLRENIKSQVRRWARLAGLAVLLSTILAAVVSGAALAPIRDILAQLERISAGEYDAPTTTTKKRAESTDELGQVRQKIVQVGQQLRGVHEIFSSLRENMNSVMAGLEDGLILFTREARAVMVSPAAEKFLGAPASHFLGKKVTDIFPAGHAMYEALHLEGGELQDVAAETELETLNGPKRISIGVQEIEGAGERMGALVTLRDLDSIESINTQLQVSERLAAVGRITAGVAHEVKNPLNSMRLWLENLKELLPAGTDGAAQQAVNVLDAEIDRLDAVVKRFLDFSRPMEVRLEPTQLSELLHEVLEIAQPELELTNV